MGTMVWPSVKAQHSHLRAGHAFLNDDRAAAVAEFIVLQHGRQRIQRCVDIRRYDNALAERQTVGLDDDRRALLLNISRSRVVIRKNPRIAPSGYRIFSSDFLKKPCCFR